LPARKKLKQRSHERDHLRVIEPLQYVRAKSSTTIDPRFLSGFGTRRAPFGDCLLQQSNWMFGSGPQHHGGRDDLIGKRPGLS